MVGFGFVHQRVGKEKAFQAGGIMQKQTDKQKTQVRKHMYFLKYL